nr:immunoglobulin light chain junction region [Macaca mulatta]MOV98894.1 immunoglobulin light chain junction region [Macaca mulatta]
DYYCQMYDGGVVLF